MTREEQLIWCKKCVNRQFDFNQGLICKLTMKVADFEHTCSDYLLDEKEQVKTAEREQAIKVQSELASAGKRFINYLVDFICYLIFSFALGLAIGNIGMGDILVDILNYRWGSYLVSFIFMSTYYILFEFGLRQTPGKLITKTVVVNEDGSHPSFMNILVRTLCRFIPFEAFSFLGNDTVGWHDSLSKTRVINKKHRPSV